MRSIAFFAVVALFATGCDKSRIYEKNHDFKGRYWPVNETPSFDFAIQDTAKRYNLYCNLRNSITYPYTRIFITYSLQDSLGNEIQKHLLSDYLFDEKTGKPHGSSGLGDIYDHQPPLLENFSFKKPGTYSIKFEQFMRTDTLRGILAVGLRVETSEEKK